MKGSEEVYKRDWYGRGGFANPRCWRRMVGGVWEYYYRHD